MGPGSGQQPLHTCDSGHSAFGGGGESFLGIRAGPKTKCSIRMGETSLLLGHEEPQTQ